MRQREKRREREETLVETRERERLESEGKDSLQ